jgi:hemoglobin-like flavoprotein
VTPEEVDLVQDQARQVGRSPELADRFYAHLFAAHPQLRPLFPDGMAGQRQRFVAELDALVRGVAHLDDLAPRAASLGRIHQAHGVGEADYDAASVALLAALADVVPGWDGPAAQAWSRAFDVMAEAMLDGYE